MKKDEYLLIKTDRQRMVSYCNQTMLALIDRDEAAVNGVDVDSLWHIATSNTMSNYSDGAFELKGFFNGYGRYKLKNGELIWIFFDAGKRYSPNGDWLGYEFIGYPASEEGISRFTQLDEELQHIEKSQSPAVAAEHLDQFIESLGCSYDEFVCTLQAL